MLATDGCRRCVDSTTRSSVSRSRGGGAASAGVASRSSSNEVAIADLVVASLLGDEDAHQCVVELVARRQLVDAEVRERATDPVGEPRRDALALGVERTEVVVEVLAGTGQLVAVRIPALRGERREVGERDEDIEVAVPARPALGGR